MALVLLLGVGTGYCNAGTYTSKTNPQHSLEYKEAVYLTDGQCKNYSRQNPGTVFRCWSLPYRHFYLDGEIADDRMDEIAKTEVAWDVFLLIFVLLLIVIGFYVYMLPTFTAYNRQHPQRFWIMMLNLFLGNTLIGWIAALIWARGGENKNV
ncbi:MAG TPA: superinfection immunity protein [Candidatus Omnitrophota bacterium]|nr:superinfection immunity protein [Candidatus Omnitrophota bacterium]